MATQERTLPQNTNGIGNFRVLRQDDIFATGKMPFPDPRTWIKSLDDHDRTEYRAIRNQLRELLGIRSFAEIPELIADPQRRAETNKRALKLIGNMYGIEGTEREVEERITQYGKGANRVIDYIRKEPLKSFAPHLEMVNEVQATHNPFDLLLITFDRRYHQRARFEAKRKVVLMGLAGSIDQREREVRTQEQYTNFVNFLRDYVWSEELLIGESEPVYFKSTHDPQSFACTELEVLSQEDAQDTKLEPNQKSTFARRRSFTVNGHQIPIYVTPRPKELESKIIKLLRKGSENPAIAVEDELGLIGVLNSVADIKRFEEHLMTSAAKAGSLMKLEDIHDTLKAPGASNNHSSSELRMYQFFAKMGGMRIEFMLFTPQAYIDYLYRKGVAHSEYEVRRIFDSEVVELLFPQDLYGLDPESMKAKTIEDARKQIESS